MATGRERVGRVEPIPGEPAAIVETSTEDVGPNVDGDWTTEDSTDADGEANAGSVLAADANTDRRSAERALVVADYHAGLEEGLRRQGVSVPSHAADRRDSLTTLLDETGAGRAVFLGDLAHAIGDPRGPEREELEDLFEAVSERASTVVVKGNHDGGIESVVEEGGFEAVSVTPTNGIRIGAVGFAHGHTWPAPEVIRAPICCIAHEHPTVRLTDSVGGRRVEPAWLRGDLDRTPFEAHGHGGTGSEADDGGDTDNTDANDADASEAKATRDDGNATAAAGNGSELVVFPAFNDLVGGTWVNVPEQGFLSPFLPEGLVGGEAYLLDGTRLGDYRQV
jgi:metallophosphoesterase superfamily enzyme